MDFRSIEPAIQGICDCAVKALGRYCKLTGLYHWDMHESFIASYVFDHLGTKISMAPEMTVSTLWRWSKTDYKNNTTPAMPSNVKKHQSKRIDLTLFAPQDVPKDQQHIQALVELKRNGSVEGDYERLPLLLLFDGCDFGAACGVIDAVRSRNWVEHEAPNRAALDGERFITSEPWNTVIEGQPRSFLVFAHLFTKTTGRAKARARAPGPLHASTVSQDAWKWRIKSTSP